MTDNPSSNHQHSELKCTQISNDFKVGDVVTLKSKDKAMTIAGYSTNVDKDGYNLVICQWFDRDDRLQTGEFSYLMLEHDSVQEHDSVLEYLERINKRLA
ncbi:YodC family protein [Xenorhabdus sp. SGI246]|uniref:YodC family protein n=1 Tax=Xenorhabdus sp. SGI246 TaxID=3158263 RepID=UPI00349F9EA3